MTVTTNELGQNNLFAKEPKMVVESYNRKGLESPQQYAETYGDCVWFPFLRNHREVLLWYLLMTELLFTITSVTFFVILGYSVEQLAETY